MPQVLFAGGRLDSLSVMAGAPIEQTYAGSFDTAYCDNSVRLVSAADLIQATFLDATNNPVNVTTGQTVYVHFEFFPGISNTVFVAATNHVLLIDSAGNPWLTLRGISGTTLGLFYNSGTAGAPVWTQIGAAVFTPAASTRAIFDIKLTLGAPHSVEWSINNNLVQAGTFTQALLTSLRALQMGNHYLGITAYLSYSQMLATEGRSTINAHVKYSRATAAGSNAGWTGAFTNVNEAINSDATIDTAVTAGLRQTYAMSDVTIPAGYSIATVMHFLRAKNDGTAPNTIKSSVRQGVTNYDAANNVLGIGTSFAPCAARYDTDPSTALAWTQAGFNAAEFGYLSAA